VLSREDYVSCSVDVYGAEHETLLEGKSAGIRVRGNSSSYYGDVEKIRANAVPYRLKFEEKISVLGLNGGAECKNWVLLINKAGSQDAVKNDIALRLGRSLLEPDGLYCSDSRLCALLLNGEFKGVYLLCEQNQVNEHRINIKEPEKGDKSLLTGYLVEIDEYREEPCFRMEYGGAAAADVNGTGRRFSPTSCSVKSDTFSEEQVDFIASYIRGVFRVLYEACEKGEYLAFGDGYELAGAPFASAQDCVEAAIDVGSVVDMYILYELMGDYDAGNSSFFMCVDFSEGSLFPRLTFTAPWDFDLTCAGDPRSGLFACTFPAINDAVKYGERSNPWFILLYKQEWFRELVEERWQQMGGAAWVSRLADEEEAMVELYAEDMDRIQSGTSEDSLKHLEWLRVRAAFLDTVWGQ
jgi:hypothetical protein